LRQKQRGTEMLEYEGGMIGKLREKAGEAK
jgi:hypothetical protein